MVMGRGRRRGQPRKRGERSALAVTRVISWTPETTGESGADDGFTVGAAVEVRTDEDGFRGLWNEATVIRRLRCRYVVHYDSLVAAGIGGSYRPLHEAVLSSQVRPRPPRSSASARYVYGVDELVEAYHHDGWCAGVVVGVVAASQRYAVCFPESREVIQFPASDLRPKMEFVRGQFVPSAQHLQGGGKALFDTGAQVEVTRSSESRGAAWFAATIVKVIGGIYYMVEYKNLSAKGGNEGMMRDIVAARYLRPIPPSEPEPRRFRLGEELEAFYHGGWYAGIVSEINLDESKYIVRFNFDPDQQEAQFDNSELRHCQKWQRGRWFCSSPVLLQGKNAKSPTKGVSKSLGHKRSSNAGRYEKVVHVQGVPTTSIKHRKRECFDHDHQEEPSWPCRSLKKGKALKTGPEAPGMDHEKSVHHSMAHDFNYAPNDIETDWRAKGVSSVNVLQRWKKKDLRVSQRPRDRNIGVNVRVPKETKLRSFRTKENITKTTTGGEEVSTDQDTEILLRSLDLKLSNPSLPSDISWDNRELCYSNEVTEDEISPLLVNDQDVPDLRDIDQFIRMADIMADGDGTTPGMFSSFGDYIVVQELVARQLSDIRTTLFELRVDSLGLCDWPSEARSEVENEVPISSSLPNTGAANHQQNLPVEDIVVENPRALTITPTELPQKEVVIPFAKCSSMWQSIELMEVFKTLPQQPHFEPLKSYDSGLREGMAIGLMVSFDNFVSNIRKLQVDDARAKFDEKLQILSTFEEHGFDVLRLRSRIKELLELQSNQRKHKAKRDGLVGKILHEKDDNDKLDAVIIECDKAFTEIDRNVIELERLKKDLREKRTSVVRRRESKNSIISKLLLDLLEAEGAYRSAENHFENILAAPL